MLKKYLPLIIITSIIILLPTVFGLAVWDRLPESVPSHFGASGEADGFSSKAMTVFGLPLFMLAMHVLCILLTFIDPKRKNIGSKPLSLLFWIVPLISIVTSAAIYTHAFGRKFNVTAAVLAVCGVLVALLGNWLPKCGQNYTFGIKTPWALNDEKNWHATHRFGGKVFIATGALMVILALLSLKIGSAAIWIYAALTVLSAVVPFVFSYVYYLRHGGGKD